MGSPSAATAVLLLLLGALVGVGLLLRLRWTRRRCHQSHHRHAGHHGRHCHTPALPAHPHAAEFSLADMHTRRVGVSDRATHEKMRELEGMCIQPGGDLDLAARADVVVLDREFDLGVIAVVGEWRGDVVGLLIAGVYRAVAPSAAAAAPVSREAAVTVANVGLAAVHPGLRNRGIAARLAEQLIHEFDAAGVCAALYGEWRPNAPSRGMQEKALGMFGGSDHTTSHAMLSWPLFFRTREIAAARAVVVRTRASHRVSALLSAHFDLLPTAMKEWLASPTFVGMYEARAGGDGAETYAAVLAWDRFGVVEACPVRIALLPRAACIALSPLARLGLLNDAALIRLGVPVKSRLALCLMTRGPARDVRPLVDALVRRVHNDAVAAALGAVSLFIPLPDTLNIRALCPSIFPVYVPLNWHLGRLPHWSAPADVNASAERAFLDPRML